jgi:hypothetical protein
MTTKVSIATVYERLKLMKARSIAIVTQKLRGQRERDSDVEVTHREFRQRELIFMNQLLNLGIRYMPFSDADIHERRLELRKRSKFDVCVVTGEPFYQLVSIGAKVRQLGYTGPMLLEITEEEILKFASLKAATANAIRYKAEGLLRDLVILTKAKPLQKEVAFDIDIPLPTPSESVKAPVRSVQPPRNRELPSVAFDIAEPPGRMVSTISRIIRDTRLAAALKTQHDYRCQVCDMRIETLSGQFYIEVHHVQPLGGGHNGVDSRRNMLVLCPNHHAMFDFGIPRFISATRIAIGDTEYALTALHILSPDAIAYHNDIVHKQFLRILPT